MADKELELKLKATGGSAAAKEVGRVEKAIEDVSSAAKKPLWDPSKLTPAWEDAASTAEDLANAGEEIANGWGEVPVRLSTTARLAAELKARQDALVQSSGDLLNAVDDLSGAKGGGGFADLIARGGGVMQTLQGIASRVGIYVLAFKAGWEASKALIEKLDQIQEAANRSLPDLARTSQAAAIQQAALASATDAANEAIQKGDEAMAGYTQRLREAAREAMSLVDAELGAELAEIDLQELEGNLTAAEAIRARARAKRVAAATKHAEEINQIERELINAVAQRDAERARYEDALDPARRAQAELDRLRGGRGASSVPQLRNEVEARNAAIKARQEAIQQSASVEELDALDDALAEAQEALNNAFQKLVEDAIAKRDAAVAASSEAERRLLDANRRASDLTDAYRSATAGPGAARFEAQSRQSTLSEQAALIRQQREEQELARKEEERRKKEEEAAARDSVNAQAATIAQGLANQIAAAPNADANTLLLSALDEISKSLANGVNAAELATTVARVVALAQDQANQGAATQALLRELGGKISTLESQLRTLSGR